MTTKNQTRVVLKEVFGTLAAIGAAGAVAAGIRGAITSKRLKSYNPSLGITPTKPAGLSGRVMQNIKNAVSAFGEKQQESWLEKSAKIDTDTHARIAAKYNLKPVDYARATAEQSRKTDLIKTLDDPKVKTFLIANRHANIGPGGQLSGLENIDIEDLPLLKKAVDAGNPSMYVPKGMTQKSTSMKDVIDKPTTIEVLDTTNPEARSFREKMVRTMITPRSQENRKKAIESINRSRQNRKAMDAAIVADKAAEPSYLQNKILNAQAAARNRTGSTVGERLKSKFKSAFYNAQNVISNLDPWNK